jgi:hypothetical protein
LGTLRKQDENKGKEQKILVPQTPSPPQKEKDRIVHECMLSLSIGCMKFLFPKLFVTISCIGL